MSIELAIIGGTGLYDWEGLVDIETETLTTPYGTPSAPIKVGLWENRRLAFLPRHGLSHNIPPHAINYRANLWALQNLQAKAIIGINAVGGIAAHTLEAPYLVIPDQAIDYTHGRATSLFHDAGDTMLHIDFSVPYTESIRKRLIEASTAAQIPFSASGTYGCTQGPRLETKAEVARLERDGCDIVGMTGLPEAPLAVELGIPYASLCIVVNPAAGKSSKTIHLDDIKLAMSQGIQQIRTIIHFYLNH